ncbi:glycosyltransferase [Microbacterium sp. KNMS]
MTDTTVRVLESVAAPGPTIKYIDQVVRYAPDDIEFEYFSWRRAIFGKYDVFHVHWPEFLIRSRKPWARRIQRVLYRVFILRLRLTRVPVVRTQHNLEPHEPGDAEERRLLRALDNVTSVRVHINRAGRIRADDVNKIVLHGDYREQLAGFPVADVVPGRFLFFGRIEPYKSVPKLIDAFSDVATAGDELRIVGRPTDSIRTQIQRALERWRRTDASVTARLEHVSDAEMVTEVTSSEAVILPYSEMHNSGVLLVALSLGRPVIAPVSDVNTAIAEEVGPGWVITYDGPFDSEKLRASIHRLRSEERGAIDLRERDWRHVGRGYADVFRGTMQKQGIRLPNIFVNVGGQRDNIGDSLLRRAYLNALRGYGNLHAYVGPDADYSSGLGLTSADRKYESPRKWLIAAFRAAAFGRDVVFAANTGEVVGTDEEWKKGRWQELLSWFVNVRGGKTIIAGVSVRPGSDPAKSSLPFLAKRAAITTWRDEWTRVQFKVGSVQPDWAFSFGEPTGEVGEREVIAIAMRGDREFPTDVWFEDVRTVLEATGARPVLVVQVRRDADRARELAKRLGAEVLEWSEGTSHAGQEEKVRTLYRSAVAVISDRIHALIVGYTEGAVPLGFSTESPEKVVRSLASATSVRLLEPAGSSAQTWLDALSSRDALMADLRQAKEALADITARIGATVGPR